MKGLYNKYKKEILIGVVVSLITAAIIKIGDWFVKVIPTIGTSIFETISNILYSSAATYSDNIILRIILLSGFSALVGLSTKTITDGLKIYKAALRLEKNSKKFFDIFQFQAAPVFRGGDLIAGKKFPAQCVAADAEVGTYFFSGIPTIGHISFNSHFQTPRNKLIQFTLYHNIGGFSIGLSDFVGYLRVKKVLYAKHA